jgi:short-subunit dehydrogenase
MEDLMAHDRLGGTVVVLTGASSGIGKGAARAFAARGASLVLAARRANLLQELAGECEALGGHAMPVVTDVGRWSDVERLADTATDLFGRFDVWVNDAGVGAIGRFDEVPISDHVKVVETDLLGTIFGCHAAIRHFRQRGEGTLINIASALGKFPAPYWASYVAAKYGVVGLGAALRQELRENNLSRVHVCTVMPMAMDTPFFDHASNYTGRESVPIPPVYDPQEVVDVIVRLVRRPEDEVIVGTAGKVTNLAHAIVPGLIDSYLARQTHAAQIEQAPPAPPTRGALASPLAEGTEVRGRHDGFKE